MRAQLEDAWKEYERTGEICNSAEGLLVHCTALTEHLQLKEEECKQLQQDKAEFVDRLKELTDDILSGSGSLPLSVVRAMEILEKHKCN